MITQNDTSKIKSTHLSFAEVRDIKFGWRCTEHMCTEILLRSLFCPLSNSLKYYKIMKQDVYGHSNYVIICLTNKNLAVNHEKPVVGKNL